MTSRKRQSETMMRTKQQHQPQQQDEDDDEDSKPSAVTAPVAAAATLAPPAAPPVTQNSRLKVRIKRFHAVAQWSWNANDDVCGICQTAFEGTAPGVKFPGEDCPVVWGKCGHAFHLQCVSKWLQQTSSKNSCPICRQSWEFGSNQS